MWHRAYTMVAGQGLGVSYSSLAQSGAILPARALGQAGIEAYPNVTHGNVVIKGHMLKLQEANGELTLGHIYNSQTQRWHFSQTKQIQILDAKNLVLTEADGHKTSYRYDEEHKVYLAPASGEGTPFLRKLEQGFEWHHPKSSLTERYDDRGRLESRSDDKGRTTLFSYNEQNELIGITGPSQARYEFRKKGHTLEIVAVDPEKETLLQTSLFDDQGTLLNTVLPGGYQISYGYDAKSKQLNHISQTDGTTLQFGYEQERLKTLQVGDALTTFTYTGTHTVDIKEGVYRYQVKLDNQGRIQALWQPRAEGGWDKNLYDYNKQGQLASLTHPDGRKTLWQYDPNTGLVTQVTQPLGERTFFYYDPLHPEELIAKATGNQAEPSVSRYIYDTDQLGRRYLRFELNPTGGVIRYHIDEKGFTVRKQVYLQSAFEISHLAPHATPSLRKLTTWIKQQPSDTTALTTYSYDHYGQTASIQRYTHINAQGAGIKNESMQEQHFTRDRFGCLLEQAVRQAGDSYALTTQGFDGLQRLLFSENPLKEKTRHLYNDKQAERVTLQPNGRQDSERYDKQGFIIERRHTVNGKSRTTKLQRDKAGRLSLKTLPDGRIYHLFQDAKGRTLVQVSVTGIVEAYCYDDGYHTQQKTCYAKPIAINEFLKNPTLNSLRDLIVPHGDDRCDYRFYDAEDRLRYEVDAEQGVKEYRYNDLGKKSTVIHYDSEITANPLKALLAGKMIVLPFNPKLDRATCYFYDKRGLVIAEQDAAGYCKGYERDAAGRIKTTTCYETKAPINFDQTDWRQVKPPSSAKDGISYHFYDGLDKPIREVDAEGYVTDYSYTPDRLLAKQHRYFNKVEPSWFLSAKQMPQAPAVHSEDETLTLSYDELGRKTRVCTSANKKTTTHYDVMGRVIAEETEDSLAAQSLDPDKHRYQQGRYNGWEELKAKATPFVAQELAKIEADPGLTPQEKTSQKEQIWQARSLRYHYDDTTGLLLSKNNGIGTSCYFYDAERRLVASVDPIGAITEYMLNAYGEEIVIRRTTLPLDLTKHRLTGGLLTENLRKLFKSLRNDAKDAITLFQRNKNGRIIATRDPEGYVNEQRFNAFDECKEELKAVDGKKPSLKITHHYDPRGLETITERQVGKKILRQERRYDNLYGKLTWHKVENQAESHYEQDKLGRTVTFTDPLKQTIKVEYDAHDRKSLERDAMGNGIFHDYTQAKREHTVSLAAPKQNPVKQKTITQNIFNETITEENTIGARETFTHAPDGQILQHQDALHHKTTHEYNFLGWKLATMQPDNTRTEMAYNPRGDLLLKTEDVTGNHLTTHYKSDALGDVVEIIAANKVRTTQTHDRRGLMVEKVQDADGLKLVTQTAYNGLKQPISLIKGDSTTPNQYEEQLLHDGFGREIGQVIDPKTSSNPKGLNITTQQRLNDRGKLMVSIDANGNSTRFIYDMAGQLQFRMRPNGGVKAWEYNANGKISIKRRYSQAIDPAKISDTISLSEFKAKLMPYADDTLRYYFYDANQQERFCINGKGAVLETLYNAAGHKIERVAYGKPIKMIGLAKLDIQAVVERVVKQASSRDRHTYYSVDAKGQIRVEISPLGIVTEQQWNSRGQIIARIVYANRLPNPADYANLTPDQILAQILPNLAKDSQRLYHFDARGLPLFSCDAEGKLTRFEHDGNGNLVQACQFKPCLAMPTSYEGFVKFAKSLQPDRQRDRITDYQFDAVNRLIVKTDELAYTEEFKLDALDNTLAYKNKANAWWSKEYDRAKRLIKEKTPEVTWLSVELANDKLNSSPKISAIEKAYGYDKVGQRMSLTESVGTSEERTIRFSYTKNQQLNSLSQDKVAVDNSKQASDLLHRPEMRVKVASSTVYNAKGKPIVERRENQAYRFKVYDSENRLIYEINERGAVIQHDYNLQGEEILITEYASRLKLDVTPLVNSGLTAAILKENLVPSPHDRQQRFIRNKGGQVEKHLRGPVFYYLPGDKQEYGKDYAETNYVYNHLNDWIIKDELISLKKGTYAKTFRFHNRRSEVLAEVDSERVVKTYSLDTYGDVIERNEYATRLPYILTLTQGTSLAELQKAIVKHDKDRKIAYQRNLRGEKITKTWVGVTYQQLSFDKAHCPQVKNSEPTHLKRYYTYNPTGKRSSITYENGASVFKFYDNLERLIAETKAKQQTYNEQGEAIWVIPLTYHFYNTRHKEVMTERFANGAVETQLNTFPQPLSRVAEDQRTIHCYDNRDLLIWLQNGKGVLEGFSYTRTKKPARSWKPLTQWSGKSYLKCLDQHFHRYDLADNRIYGEVSRDKKIIVAAYYDHDAFNQVTQEGASPNNYAIYRHYDGLRHCWLTNANKGIPTLSLTNLSGKETLSATSAVVDLNTQAENLAVVLTWGPDKLERVETTRNLTQQIVAHSSPAYYQDGTWIKPVNNYQLDVWNNIIQHTNSRGDMTDKEFNYRNQCVSILKPEVDTLLTDNTVKKCRPSQQTGFDERGFKIASRNGNGYVTGYIRNKAGHMLHQIEPDGTTILTQDIDALTRVIREKNARGAIWHKRYDHLNQLVETISPLGKRFQVGYNENNERSLVINEAGYAWRYNYSALNDIEGVFEPTGINKAIKRDHNHQLLGEKFCDGTSISKELNYFGLTLSAKDLSGVKTQYGYDWNMQLRTQTTADAAKHGTTIQITGYSNNTHQVELETGGPYVGQLDVQIPLYTLQRRTLAEQNLEYIYSGGRLQTVHDRVQNVQYSYRHDTEGLTISWHISNTQGLFYETWATHDALDRPTYYSIKNHSARLILESARYYDSEDNRRRITWGVGTLGSGQYNLAWKDAYYTFDGSERILARKTAADTTRDLKFISTDVVCAYQNGLKVFEQGKSFDLQQLKLVNDPRYPIYDADENLIAVDIDSINSFTKQPERIPRDILDYHATGWIQVTKTLSWFSFLEQSMACNENGWMLRHFKHNLEIYNNSFNVWGQPLTQTIHSVDEQINVRFDTTDTLENLYVGYNAPSLSIIKGKRIQYRSDERDPYYSSNAAELLYDVNNNATNEVIWNHPSYQCYPNTPYTTVSLCQTTPDGRILWKNNFDTHGNDGTTFAPTPDIYTENYFVTPDAYLGGTKLKPRTGITQKSGWGDLTGAWDIVYDVTHCGDPNYNAAHLKYIPVKAIVNRQDQYVPASVFRPLDFDLPEPVEFIREKDIKPEPPRYYEVQPGDTLNSIGRQLGNNRLARAIARANGYVNVYSPLKPGEKVRIPVVERYTNKVDEETSYAKIRAAIIGSIYPDLTIIPPPQDDDDDFFHQALRILVPIVLTIILGPAGLGLNIVAAAAISNVVSQMAFVATGLQRDFSLTSLLVTTLTAGIGTPVDAFSGISLEQVGEHLLEHAMLNLTGQLLEVAVDLQDELDFKQMAMAAVNGVVNDYVSFKTLKSAPGIKVLGGSLSTGINMGIASMIQGVPFNTERALLQMAGTGIEAYTVLKASEREARQKSEDHQEISQASQGKDVKGASQTHYARNKGPGFFSKPKEQESLLKPIKPDDIVAILDKGEVNWPKHHSPLDYVGASGKGIGDAVANDAHYFIDHHPLTAQGVEDRFHFMVETALFLNSSFSNKYAVVSHLTENLVHTVEARFQQYQAADGLERAYMLGHDTEEVAKFAGGLLVGRGLFGSSSESIIGTRLFRTGSEGVEPASKELLQAIESKGRTIVIAKPGTDEYRYLESIGAEANVGGTYNTHILIKENPSKAGILEEFLHGTQNRLGIIDKLGQAGAEYHVKDFMIRHQRMLGLGREDIQILEQLRTRDFELMQQANSNNKLSWQYYLGG